MVVVQVVMYSLLVAFVSAGFVWYGWGLMRNIRVLRQHRAEAKAEAAEPEPEES